MWTFNTYTYIFVTFFLIIFNWGARNSAFPWVFLKPARTETSSMKPFGKFHINGMSSWQVGVDSLSYGLMVGEVASNLTFDWYAAQHQAFTFSSKDLELKTIDFYEADI